MSQKEKPQRSDLVPFLLAVLVCDVAVADPATGKKNLIGIFDRINVGKFPAARPVFVYIKMTDAEGYYDVDVRFVERNTNAILGAIQGNINVKDRFRSVDFFLPLPPIPLPHAGRYEFQIWTNDVFLGSTFLDVEPRDNKIAKKEEA